MNPLIHLRIAGVLVLMLAALNLVLPRHFGWRVELQRVSLLTRQVFAVHLGFIVVILALFGLLSACFTEALLEPGRLPRLVLAGMAIVWSLRLLAQWFVYDPALWRGDAVRTAIHIGSTILWAYLVLAYALALSLQRGRP